MSRIKQLNTIITDAPLSIAILADNVKINKDSISSRTYYILYPLACNDFFLSRYIYRAVTRARACALCCVSFQCVGMCKYDDANVLFYACWLARRQMPWSSLQGFVRTAGCTLRRLCLPEVGLLHLHLYHVLTDDVWPDDAWADAL